MASLLAVHKDTLLFCFLPSPQQNWGASPSTDRALQGTLRQTCLDPKWRREQLHFQSQLPSELKQHVTVYQYNAHYSRGSRVRWDPTEVPAYNKRNSQCPGKQQTRRPLKHTGCEPACVAGKNLHNQTIINT